jgi:hypothetical protein
MHYAMGRLGIIGMVADSGMSIDRAVLVKTVTCTLLKTFYTESSCGGYMGRVFISYSRRDTETVDRVVDSMCNAGLEVWLDRHDIQAGNTWRVQIVQAIDTCDAFVLMLSPNSIASDNVRKEIDLAQDSGRTIFPVMLQPVKLPPEIR